MFNPEEFNNTTIEGEFETKMTLVPAGEYNAVIENFEAKTVGEANRPIISATYKLVNCENPELEGRYVWDTIWLDVTENGQIERGPNKNLKLGQVLEAVGLNGKPWSPPMLPGQVVTIKVTEKLNKRTEEMENGVSRVVAS